MHKKRLLWQLYPPYLLVTLAALAAAGWFAFRSIERFSHGALVRTLQSRAQGVDRLLDDKQPLVLDESLKRICSTGDDSSQSQVTIIARDGTVAFDSLGDTQPIGNLPEVVAALQGSIGNASRVGPDGRHEMEYVAIPIVRGGEVAGALRAGMSNTATSSDARAMQMEVGLGALAIAVMAALVGLFVSRRIARPLEEMRAGAECFARGELSQRLTVPDTVEMARLAETLNDMASQLDERIRSAVHQSNEQRAVLTSMAEGVIAVDLQQHVISLNRAASELLNYAQGQAAGRPLQEVIRNIDLRRFVGQALNSDEPISGDIKMLGNDERVLEAHGTAMRGARGQTIGAVIVLNDVTDYRRLENVRRDFVANVSHELKTPITSVKGFVETLLDGALDNREDAERFLRIIAKQADRLHSIIDDLLSLSRIEQSEESSTIPLESARLRDVLDNAVHECQPQAGERGIEFDVDCDENLLAKINSPLLVQAVLNLLDNAVKYSEDGGRIEVRATTADRHVVIAVRDQGCGIPQEHLSRIFERFYRVDRARSRKLGGTGLGLSIVKHIVNVHRGKVTVESMPGRGSTFKIHLPVDTATYSTMLVKAS